MYLVYSLLLTLGLIVLIPQILFQVLAHGKYVSGVRERLGSLPRLQDVGRPTVWLHCVSVGETQAARPLVARLREAFPKHRLVVSTITLTGQTLAREVFKSQADHVIYFPFDWYWCVRRALAAIRPDVVLIIETELWPNFLRCCAETGVPVALVNGRISTQSFRGYRLIKFFVARVLQNVSMAVMQSEGDAERLKYLGISPDRLFVSGNLKFDATPPTKSDALTQALRERFAIRSDVPLILAASTHSSEEKIIIDSFKKLKERRSIRLMIAPRHPERFAEVGSLLENSQLLWRRRSAPASTDDATADVILLDSIGELPATYSLATIVFVGGSMVKTGGHNVLEPAGVGAAIVTGAHTDNFKAVVDLLDQEQAIIKLPALEREELVIRLYEVFQELLDSPTARKQMGEKAYSIMIENRGAAEKTIKLISLLFSSSEFADRFTARVKQPIEEFTRTNTK